MSNSPSVVDETNLSIAWGKIFLEHMKATTAGLHPITLTISQLDNQCPQEDPRIRKALDEALATNGLKSTKETAATIFPYQIWKLLNKPKCRPFSDFYLKKYLRRHQARVKVKGGKIKETYFARMISATGVRKRQDKEERREINQLEYIANEWHRNSRKRPRHSSLMASCFDPVKDQIGSAQGGFPCLHEVSFGYDDAGQLAINAFYPTEYVFERAYGNYLGLCHLGLFMAQELGQELARFNCFIGRPEKTPLGKGPLRELEDVVKHVVSEHDRSATQGY